jgi:hypothetical protein
VLQTTEGLSAVDGERLIAWPPTQVELSATTRMTTRNAAFPHRPLVVTHTAVHVDKTVRHLDHRTGGRHTAPPARPGPICGGG